MINAPMAPHPSTAASTNGKPWTTTAARDASDSNAPTITMSAATSSAVRMARVQATLALISDQRLGWDLGSRDPHRDEGPTSDAGHRESAVDGFETVPHVRKPGTAVGPRRIEA